MSLFVIVLLIAVAFFIYAMATQYSSTAPQDSVAKRVRNALFAGFMTAGAGIMAAIHYLTGPSTPPTP